VLKDIKRVSDAPKMNASKLFLIGISQSGRGTGGAGLLIDAFTNEAFQRGFESVILTVHRDNLRARAAYEKSGWVLNDRGGEAVEYCTPDRAISDVS
jgi:RimJ/RimL family protein N-acetyltransferase